MQRTDSKQTTNYKQNVHLIRPAVEKWRKKVENANKQALEEAEGQRLFWNVLKCVYIYIWVHVRVRAAASVCAKLLV